MSADGQREDEIANLKTAWESSDPGRRDRGEVRTATLAKLIVVVFVAVVEYLSLYPSYLDKLTFILTH